MKLVRLFPSPLMTFLNLCILIHYVNLKLQRPSLDLLKEFANHKKQPNLQKLRQVLHQHQVDFMPCYLFGESYLSPPSTAFSDIVQPIQPAQPAPALETPLEQPSFEAEAPTTSDAELTPAATTKKQAPHHSSKTAKKQAPHPSEKNQHVPGWEFFFVLKRKKKLIKFFWSLIQFLCHCSLLSSAH